MLPGATSTTTTRQPETTIDVLKTESRMRNKKQQQKLSSSSVTERAQRTTTETTPASLVSTTVKAQTSVIQLNTSIARVEQPALTSTIKPIEITTRPLLISTTLMMYPDEIPNAKIEGNVINDEFQHNLSVDTISLPFSLLSLFGGKPK